MSHHTLEIIEHIASRNPERLEPGVSKHSIAFGVAVRVAAHGVSFAIDLDRQAALEAGEISNVAVARELATEPKSLRPLPELLP